MPPRIEKAQRTRPRLVLALSDDDRAELLRRKLRRRGWEVHSARAGPEARRLTQRHRPNVVILDTDLAQESGWLTCAKITLADGGQRVILVHQGDVGPVERLAHAVGAATIVADDTRIIAELDLFAGAQPRRERGTVKSERET
jgi:DNA-binding response OmpR family regulator